ncbi:MAG TPA: glycoside hydrolase family 5 protein [Streptosporangiaceae bacterium]
MKYPWARNTDSPTPQNSPTPPNSRRWWQATARIRVGVVAALVAVLALVSVAAFRPDSSSHLFGSDKADSAPQGPLHTRKGQIVDANGQVIKLTGVNWFGAETGTFAPHGLWARNWQQMLDQIVSSGFNTVRLPYSNELFDPASKPNGIDYKLNPDLKGLSGPAIYDKIVNGATGRGLMVILDQHRPDQYGQSNLWYTSKLSEQKWISDWVMLAHRYAGNPRVIGADLHNEPHGEATWGDGNPRTDWRLAAEKAGNAVLAANPNWLVFVEGVDSYRGDGYWWGGDLRGAQQHPVRLSKPDKLVYSAHDYGPGVFNQNWFQRADFPKNMPALWDKHWGYLQRLGNAPVLVGEFGGRKSTGNSAEAIWQNALFAYMKARGISYTYWCWNPDSGDTGGMLQNDWKTLDPGKMRMVSTYQSPLPQANKGRAGQKSA